MPVQLETEAVDLNSKAPFEGASHPLRVRAELNVLRLGMLGLFIVDIHCEKSFLFAFVL